MKKRSKAISVVLSAVLFTLMLLSPLPLFALPDPDVVYGGGTYETAPLLTASETTIEFTDAGVFFKFVSVETATYTIRSIGSNDADGILYESSP